jgi:hypothetical protein
VYHPEILQEKLTPRQWALCLTDPVFSSAKLAAAVQEGKIPLRKVADATTIEPSSPYPIVTEQGE